jgi:D-alanine-D-alanine ligase
VAPRLPLPAAMRITVLTHIEGTRDATPDVVVEQIAAALAENGHDASVLAVHDDLGKLVGGLKRRKPDLVFNVMETFGTDQLGAVPVAGLLALLGIPFTGGGPGEYYLQEDKALTKKLLSFDGIDYPGFAVFSQEADIETGGNLRMPLFVKPLRMDASIGIDAGSLVRSALDMMKRVVHIHEKLEDAALVEEYIEGREFYVGVLGNQEPIAFPPIEVDFSKMPDGAPHILEAKAKWDEESPEYKGTKSVIADIPDELRARLHKVALGAYRALRVRDYGRIDMRLTEAGDIHVIEVNASCYLERSSEFAMSAEAADISYEQLIGRIVDEAIGRTKAVAPPKPKKKRKRAA